MVQFNVECLNEIRDGWEELLPRHWKEVAHWQDDIPLDMHWDAYEKLSMIDALVCISARDNGKLVGYYIGVIQPGLHYKSTLTCSTDMFYLAPEYRAGWTGIKMFRFVESYIKSRGVKRWICSHKVGLDLEPIYSRLGLEPIDKYYDKVLQE